MTNHLKGFRGNKQHVKTAKGRKISSTHWLSRHINDPFVQLAKEKGYRSRAAFKLIEVIDKFAILQKVNSIVDLGCAPGSWLQVLRERLPKAKIVGIDLQEVSPIAGVEFIKGDFLEEESFKRLEDLCNEKVQLVISDMAPASSGYQEVDHLRHMALVEMAVEFCKSHLREDGAFVAKIIRGRDDQALIKELKLLFATVKLFKPKASYKDSSEIYVVALRFAR